jgi:anti-sigma factor RsiW
MDMHNRDRFELLCAYLDGEVTAKERRQIEDWLTTDPEVQRLYARVLKLRPRWQTMPVPAVQQPVERTVQKAFPRLNTRPKRTVVWGGTALVAVFIGALLGILPGSQSPVPTTATARQPMVKPEALMLALNTPVAEIPKSPTFAKEKSVKQTGVPR